MSKLQNRQQKNSKNYGVMNRKKIWIISVTACIGVILLAVMLEYLGFFNMISGFFVPSGEVQKGSLPISDGLKDVKSIPKGEVKYRLNKTVTFENGYAKGDIMLEDPAACEFNMQFVFYIEKDNTLIYESPILKPGEYLSGDKLKKKLKKGEYKCIYNVKAFKSSGVLQGETGGYLTITVEN